MGDFASLWDLLATAARRQPARPALADTARVLTYRSLAAEADALARQLEHGGRPGEAVGILLRRSIDAVAALAAVSRLGRMPVLLPPSATVPELSAMVEAAAPSLVLTAPGLVETARRA